MHSKVHSSLQSLPKLQEFLYRNPHKGIKTDLKFIYEDNNILLGWPKKLIQTQRVARENTVAILGVALGDEGKGRFIDNTIEKLLQTSGVKKVYVIRYQGGNNAGHTIEKDGIKLDLHLLPSSVLYPKTTGIMDRGMLIHVEDLKTEIDYVEEKVGPLKSLYLSEDAILCTDLERAEEWLNRTKTGKAKGGTSRGIGPSYAHHYDRLGLKIYDLLNPDWMTTLEDYYDRYEKEFRAFNIKLADVAVPDFYTSHKTKESVERPVGSKKEFLQRLQKARSWLLKRDIATNTFAIHQKAYMDTSAAILFEGAQAAGLDAWLGTLPDITASNTSAYGLREGTAFWRIFDIEDIIGVFKIPYTSSVGARRMPTHIDLPKDLQDLPKKPSHDQQWAAFVREEAHEYGTTTGRPRDINYLDLEFLRYNSRMSGVKALAGTHLDISQEHKPIKVCTHYTDKNGKPLPYQPGLRYQKDVVPQYAELPGWDGTKCLNAKTVKQLPENAVKFLAFIQARTGFPIVAVTTGSQRENFISIPQYSSR